jgi:hypothetical protein
VLCNNEDVLSETAGLFPDDSKYRQLRAAAKRLIEGFYRTWNPPLRPGRRSTDLRNVLISDLAKAYRRYANLDPKDPVDCRNYPMNVATFIAHILQGNEIRVYSLERVLRVLPQEERTLR